MDRTFGLLGALAGFIAVALGAFGAHGLRGRLSPDMLAVFETGVRYQMYHSLALVAIAFAMGQIGHARWIVLAGWSFVTGVVLFSGSLYLLAMTGIRTLGAITPIGGVAFLAGWVCLALAAAAR